MIDMTGGVMKLIDRFKLLAALVEEKGLAYCMSPANKITWETEWQDNGNETHETHTITIIAYRTVRKS